MNKVANESVELIQWISSKEASELTGYSKQAFVKAVERGTLNAVRRGKMFFYKKSDVLNYVELMRTLGSKKFTSKKFQEQTQDDLLATE